MKKLLFICLLGVGLMAASCGGDDGDFLDNTTLENNDPMKGNFTPPEGEYNVVWIVDKEVVDTATLTVGAKKNGMYTPISHFPMRYFLELVGKKADPEDFIYEWVVSEWLIDYKIIGFSENKLYLRNATWAPRIHFGVKDEYYEFLIYMNDGTHVENWYTSMIYDIDKDMWSGSAPVYGFQLINLTNRESESWDMTFPVPINMTFQTTGRKK